MKTIPMMNDMITGKKEYLESYIEIYFFEYCDEKIIKEIIKKYVHMNFDKSITNDDFIVKCKKYILNEIRIEKIKSLK